MNVVKSGRTTGITQGIVDGLSLSATINYDTTPNTFHDQIHIVPRPPWPAVDYEVSRGGDSGSVWINEATGRAVGLHFAGETDPAPTSEHGIANRMSKVAAATGLNFSLTPLFFCRFGKARADVPPKAFLSDLPPKLLLDSVKLPALDQSWLAPWLTRIGTPGGGVLAAGNAPAPFVFATPHHFGEPGDGAAQGAYEAALAHVDAMLQQYQAARDQLAAALARDQGPARPIR